MYRNLHIVIHLAANGRCGCTRKRRKLRTPVGAESGLSRGVSCRRPVACVQCVESDALGELLFLSFRAAYKKKEMLRRFLATKQRWRYGTPFSEGPPHVCGRARLARGGEWSRPERETDRRTGYRIISTRESFVSISREWLRELLEKQKFGLTMTPKPYVAHLLTTSRTNKCTTTTQFR